MKKLFLIPALALGLSSVANPNLETVHQQLTKVVEEYAKAGDNRDTKTLDQLLHTEFRSVVNRLFGSKDLSVMSKTVYLDLMKQEKIGGDQRKVEILNIDVMDHTAYIKARFSGKKLIFTTFLLLAKNADDQWQVVNDMPLVEKK